MKRIYIYLFCLIANIAFSQPANDNCASAASLTIGAALTCGQTTQSASLQVGECYTNYGGGASETSVWYRFTASNDSLVLNVLNTIHLIVYRLI